MCDKIALSELHTLEELENTLMKKTLILTIILLVLILIPGYSFADSYTFNDGNVSISLEGKLTAYTKNSDVSGIKDAPDNFDLLVINEDLGYHWYFYFMNSDGAVDFNSLTDDQITNLLKSDSADLGSADITSEICDNGHKYLVIDSVNGDTDQYVHFYVTGVGRTLYYFVAPSDGSPLNDAKKADFRKVIDGVEYTISEPPTKEEERQAAMIRILKRFGICVIALVVFAAVKVAYDKIRGSK